MTIETRLSEVLSEFARTLVTDFPIEGILDHLVLRIVDVLPIDAAGVTLISPNTDPEYIAASDESALLFEQLQTEFGEGPCIAAYTSGESVSIPDLQLDDRFPTFAPRAVEAGLQAVFTFPLRRGEGQLGALDLYRKTAGPLDPAATAAAQTLADVAAAYLHNARARADLRESAELHRHSALHDALTGLPNRVLLIERLEHAVQRCRRSGKMVAIMFADLDHFKAVNDTHGHHIGDALLTSVAQRLTGLLRPADTLARLSGDEFVILCEDLDDAAPVESLAARIGDCLAEPFELAGVQVQVSASVGIAFAGRGDDVPEEIIQEADTAMYQAKRRGGAHHGIIDLREQRSDSRRANLSHDLRGALSRGELRTEYQPVVATVGGRITGVEALLRWSHPQLGAVTPETAVPLAEKLGLIGEIGRWVLEQACTDRQRWQARTDRVALEMAVNVSAHQLMAPGFADSVAAVLQDTHTDPKLLTLEVTESVLIHDSERVLEVLNELKATGVLLALDDFGTGYSSLAYLKRFPVDILKVDQAFVADLDRDAASRLIVGAIVRLAHGLGMRVVAEGVETAAQYQEVLALGCDSYQGYYFAHPARAADLDTVMTGRGGHRLSPTGTNR